MHLLTASEAQSALDGVVHFDTQAAARSIDLTVAAVFRLAGPGQIDFGGSEFGEAPLEELPAEQSDPEDDYGWWTLREGTYLAEFNERLSLEEGHVAFIQPHERLIAAGASHAGRFAQDSSPQPLRVVLSVGAHGLRIKENARLSTLLLFEAA